MNGIDSNFPRETCGNHGVAIKLYYVVTNGGVRIGNGSLNHTKQDKIANAVQRKTGLITRVVLR